MGCFPKDHGTCRQADNAVDLINLSQSPLSGHARSPMPVSFPQQRR
jgi:hypothetical protein